MTDAAQQPTTTDRAETFLLGNLLEAAKGRFCALTKPWAKLDEEAQGELLRGLADDIRGAVREAIGAIASHERLTFRAEVDNVTFKGQRDVKAVLTMVANIEAHALADAAGGMVTVVIEDVSRLLALPEDATKGEPDSRPLFDASTEGTALDTKRDEPNDKASHAARKFVDDTRRQIKKGAIESVTLSVPGGESVTIK